MAVVPVSLFLLVVSDDEYRKRIWAGAIVYVLTMIPLTWLAFHGRRRSVLVAALAEEYWHRARMLQTVLAADPPFHTREYAERFIRVWCRSPVPLIAPSPRVFVEPERKVSSRATPDLDKG